jgi:hypothetical protein
MTGNVVICMVDAVMYVVLSKAEKHVPYWEFVGTYHRMNNAILKESHKRRLL